VPAEAQFYFKMIRRVTAFDPINMDGLFDSVTGLESKPLSTNYEALGYESGYFVRNMGSLPDHYSAASGLLWSSRSSRALYVWLIRVAEQDSQVEVLD